MTTAAHTPGQWKVFDVFTDLEIVTARSTANETESIVQFKGQRNAKANARLMAAAPDLLNALECVLLYAADVHSEDLDLDVYAEARSATKP